MSSTYCMLIWCQYILLVHVLHSVNPLLQKQDIFCNSKNLSLLADISLIFYNFLLSTSQLFSRSRGCVEVGWVGYMLPGVTKIAFLENLIDCICLVSIIYTCIYNIFIAVLMINERCKFARTLQHMYPYVYRFALYSNQVISIHKQEKAALWQNHICLPKSSVQVISLFVGAFILVVTLFYHYKLGGQYVILSGQLYIGKTILVSQYM